jgi:hypothetical protein
MSFCDITYSPIMRRSRRAPAGCARAWHGWRQDSRSCRRCNLSRTRRCCSCRSCRSAGYPLHHVVDRQGPLQGRFQRRQVPRQQLVARPIVLRRPRPRHSIVRRPRHAQTKVIRLHALVGRAYHVVRPRRDFRQQAAGGIEGRHGGAKLMIRRALPHTRERFAVLGRSFASSGVRHARLRHEVSLVARDVERTPGLCAWPAPDPPTETADNTNATTMDL